MIQDLDNEEWKQYKDSNYYISNLGRVKNIKRGSLLKHQILPKGYCIADMNFSGERKRLYIHRLVAECFIPNPDNKPQVNHINGVKGDNKVENLEWVTSKENMQHAIKSNLKGVYSKLSEDQINEIRTKYIPIKMSCVKLAKEYGVSSSTIANIIGNKVWVAEEGFLSEKLYSKDKSLILTTTQIEEIKQKYIPRVYTTYMLAEEYDVTQSTIMRILKKENTCDTL